MMTIGDRIKHICDQSGLTQRELARRANVTEVSMSRYINGFREPKAHDAEHHADQRHLRRGLQAHERICVGLHAHENQDEQ